MKRSKILLLFCLSLGFMGADVYQWTDSAGVVHFGDTPPQQGAKKLHLPAVQTYAPASPAPSGPTSPHGEPKDENAEVYEKIEITLPKPQQTIWDNNGNVPVTVQLKPALKEGDKLLLVYDGSPLGNSQTGTQFILKNVYRGTHTVAVQVVDKNGQVIMTSDAVTFYLQRGAVRSGKAS